MDQICQSCGMPVLQDNQKGTNADGSKSDLYCVYCFADGGFTKQMTMEQYIEDQIRIAQEKLNIPEDEARQMATDTIPNLARWKQA